MGGPFWEVESGRRDGRISNITEALFNLPPPFANITVLKTAFARWGLSVKDHVVLSGIFIILFCTNIKPKKKKKKDLRY